MFGHRPIELLGASLRRERERVGLSVSELAKRAGLAKSTLSQLENGVGNPSLETLWSLAMTLGVPVSQLIGQSRQPVNVIRANEGISAASELANYVATLLASCPPRAQRDIYRIKAQPGEPRRSKAHMPGTVEHVVICSGRAMLGPVDAPVELVAGDYISYPADTPHIFEACVADTTAVMLIEHG
jgi:transcriptional regulator with XRE-family HTH domain